VEDARMMRYAWTVLFVAAVAAGVLLVPETAVAGTCSEICSGDHCWGDSTQDCSSCTSGEGMEGDPCSANADCACTYECDYNVYQCVRRCDESCYGDWDGSGTDGDSCSGDEDCHCAFECLGATDDDASDDDDDDDDDNDDNAGCGC
jgi:hypothetical protein